MRIGRRLYRLFARELARYRRVVVQQLDLRDFAELPDPGEKEDPRTTASRGRRFTAALGELLGACADAVTRAGGEWTEVDPAWTTQTCFACGKIDPFDAAGSIDHTCAQCGSRWDQDENAARNLLRAAQSGKIVGGRSRMKAPDTTENSPAAKRRVKGLATRRAKRSKLKVDTLENKEVSE